MDMKIPLSFKQRERDMYEFLKKQLSPSIYIKQLIKEKMEQEQPKVKESRNFLDF